jgi:hypothetical protein
MQPVQGTPAPPPAIIVERKDSGCLQIAGLSCTLPMIGCAALVVCSLATVVIIALLVGVGRKRATEEAIERNGGYGALESPIPANTWAQFNDGSVMAVRLVRPATSMVEGFSTLNEAPPAGADYVLVWLSIYCDKDKCDPPRDTDIHLIDAAGAHWKEPPLLILDDDLDHQEAVRGATVEGWQAFEFPTGGQIQTIRVKWGPETLHLAPPPG